ncbi:MAG: CGNR zinc finger domain-containing protein [Gemmatimonadaceae bacterium]|jgi:predicted RNA-binding Zn ribbon-like protein|nr:CGNR zinc finger domain-containing protein [Gemmatimonadaceae bacterium]MBX9857684.1 CGNR zinc finger domain-containing protein [Gemmatimonadaceae bacterium]
MPVTSSKARRAESRDQAPGPVPQRTRLWLDFVNTDTASQPPGGDLLRDFEALLTWLQSQDVVDEERAGGIRRRAVLQPAAAAATLVDARRVRAALRALAERGQQVERVRDDALIEINRVLGRSAGTRRLDPMPGGGFTRIFVPTGDAFAGLMIPIVESAADTLIDKELGRVRRCADPRCHRVFLDGTKNGLRRWCDMGTCGNRAKAARHRARTQGSA